MIKKKIIDKGRVRRIDGGFSFIPHRFLTGGFLSQLHPDQLLLYFFLVLAADRYGLSFYSYDKICSLLEMSLDQYVEARDVLIKNDLIAFDGTLFQVLELPSKPIAPVATEPVTGWERSGQRSRIKSIIQQSFWRTEDGR